MGIMNYNMYTEQIDSLNYIKNQSINNQIIPTNEKTINEQIIDETIVDNNPPIDLIKTYDYRILEDPMKDPKRRPARHILGPFTGSPLFNYPTRGYRDNFSQQGYLVNHDAPVNDENKVLQLFGREKWPNSSSYEYYITFQSGGNERKYELDKYTKELYDGDEVRVDILNDRKYRVKLFKQEGLEYNPFWFQ